MYTFILILFVIIAVLLILIILLQSSKASGMELFGGGNQNIFGAQTGDILTKTTTILASLFLFGTVLLAVFQAKKTSIVEEKIKEMQQSAPPSVMENEESAMTGTNLIKTNKK